MKAKADREGEAVNADWELVLFTDPLMGMPLNQELTFFNTTPWHQTCCRTGIKPPQNQCDSRQY